MAEVVGVGSLLADLIIEVSEDFLTSIQGQKGGSEFTSPTRINEWVELSGQTPKVSPGGSAANVIRSMAQFGHSSGLITKVGGDARAHDLNHDLRNSNIDVRGKRSALPTGAVLSMVTPDGQRTMRTYLGANESWLPEELEFDDFRDSRVVHIEGYTLTHPGLTARAMAFAKEAGALVSFDLSSFEMVAHYKEEIIALTSQYVDILFANRDETHTLTGCVPQRGCSLLKDLCRTAVVTMGPEGCWVGHEGHMYQCPAYPVVPLDTTGAGDLFTSGFLHGFLQGRSLPECARIGALAGRAVVQVLGTSLPPESWEEIRQQAAKELLPVQDRP